MTRRKMRSSTKKKKTAEQPVEGKSAAFNEANPVMSDGESPVVSDDDGVDAAARALGAPGPGFPAMSEVEHLPDYGSSSESDAAPAPGAGGLIADADAGEESDSTIEGDANPVGDIPMRWYEGYDHIGYGLDGEKLIPQHRPSALELAADPHAWRRVYDEKNDEDMVLTHEELKAIARLRAGRYPGAALDDEGETIAWSGAVRDLPLPAGTEPKRRFLPSRHEARLVVRYVRAMREGRMRRPSERRLRADGAVDTMRYDVWAGHEPKGPGDMSKAERARDVMRVPAPKVPPPGHAESYNPPAEYLPSAAERAEWERTAPEDRAADFLPEKSDALRHVPAYANGIRERFERCLDLYLAVRIKKDVERVSADDLVPKLPSPRDLRPFPSGCVLDFAELPARARSIDVHPAGQWLLSGSDDGVVRAWEAATGFLRAEWDLGARVPKVDGKTQPVMQVAWRPADDSFVFAAAAGKTLFLVAAGPALRVEDVDAEELLRAGEAADETVDETGDEEMKTEAGKEDGGKAEKEDGGEAEGEGEDDDDGNAGKAAAESRGISWVGRPGSGEGADGCTLLEVVHPRVLRGVCWHRKGDYVGTVGREAGGGTVAVHRVTARSSRVLFRRRSAGVQCVRFHPTRPFLLVATMHHVRIYNLAAEQAVKVLKPGVRWISSIDVHPSGDHVLATSYDKRVCWFDLDLSTRPYKTLRNHDRAVRQAKFHPRLPLFADAADDGAVHVFHGMAYDDLAKNALIVPVKKLAAAHAVTDSLGVLDIAWHPRLPWLFSAGADRRIRLFADTS